MLGGGTLAEVWALALALASAELVSCGSGRRRGGAHDLCGSGRASASCRTSVQQEGGRLE